MGKLLWVDDERPAPEGWVWVKTADEAIDALRGGQFAIISLDHDLGEIKTGYDILLFLEAEVYNNPEFRSLEIRIHTANPVGRAKMQQAVRSIEKILAERKMVMSKGRKIGISSMFRFLTGDMDYLAYGGKWYRKVAATRYHVIELTNMWSATGDKSIPQYNVSLSEVEITCSQLKNAMRSCGPEDEDFQDNELAKVEALSSYGADAPLGQWNGGNARKLLAEARGESRSLDDPAVYEAAMSRPVNALGSTTREYAAGDFKSAIVRGLERGDTNAKLMAKLHGIKPDEDTIEFSTLNQDGTVTNVRHLSGGDIKKCKFFIMVPEHYREDGSCKCNDREHRAMMISKWGYTEESFEGIPLME